MASALNEAKNNSKSPFVRGMVRASNGFKLIYPSNSSILPDRLNFDWKGRENSAEAKITVKSVKGDFNFSFDPNLNADRITWPMSGPKLVPCQRIIANNGYELGIDARKFQPITVVTYFDSWSIG